MSEQQSIRELSRRNAAGEYTYENLRTGALLRIADATELMAKRYADLVADRDWYKRQYDEQRAQSAKLGRRVIALRGVITRMKRKATV